MYCSTNYKEFSALQISKNFNHSNIFQMIFINLHFFQYLNFKVDILHTDHLDHQSTWNILSISRNGPDFLYPGLSDVCPFQSFPWAMIQPLPTSSSGKVPLQNCSTALIGMLPILNFKKVLDYTAIDSLTGTFKS